MIFLKTRSQIESDLTLADRLKRANVTDLDFSGDNFLQRRASQAGAGVAYDPESHLTGEEIAQGLDYDCPRVWPSPQLKALAVAGELPLSDIPTIAPRVRPLVLSVPIRWTGSEVPVGKGEE